MHHSFFVSKTLTALLLFVMLALGLAAPGQAAALSLEQAKSSGVVGEKLTGYLGLVQAAGNSEASQLMASIKQQRREEYQSIAARNGTELKVVEALAAKKAIERTPAGYFIESSDSGWVKK